MQWNRFDGRRNGRFLPLALLFLLLGLILVACGRAFISANGRTLYYTALEEGTTDTEVRQVPIDGSESPERLYRDVVLLDVSWTEESSLQPIR